MKEITPDIFVETRYPPYNLGLIVLDEGAIVIDVPPRPSHARSWLREVQQQAGHIAYVVLTDAQPDRLIGAVQWEVPIIAAEETARRLNELRQDREPWEELLLAARERYPEEASALHILEPRRAKLATNQRLLIHCQEPPLVAESVTGAAPGSLWFFVPAKSILFAGDCVTFNTPPLLEHTPSIQLWTKMLATLAQRRPVQRVVPGRGTDVILRGELETQREFFRVVQRTAVQLASQHVPGEGLSHAITDIQQIFFPTISKNSPAMQRLRRGLTYLVQTETSSKQLLEIGDKMISAQE